MAACLVAAGTSISQAAVSVQDKNTIYIDGALNTETLHNFTSLFTDEITAVVIRSGLGEQAVAGEIGHIIRSRDIRVIVKDYCIGPCANYVFTSARHHTVLPLSIVTFHYYGTMITRLIAGIDQGSLDAGYRDKTAAEAPYFEELGPRAILLLESNLETAGDCYKPVRTSDGRFGDIGFATYAKQWVPRRSYMEALGIRIDGYWPGSQTELWSTYQAIYSPGTTTSIKMGRTDTPMSIDDAKNEISRLPDCVGPLLNANATPFPPKRPAP
jgi:hypothetical protein